jgi:hypothetical protein
MRILLKHNQRKMFWGILVKYKSNFKAPNDQIEKLTQFKT